MFMSFVSYKDTVSLIRLLVTTTTKSAMTAPANSSPACRLPITVKPVGRTRSCCPFLLPRAIAALHSTPAKVGKNWSTHQKNYPVKGTKATSTVNSARKASAAFGFSLWYSSYPSLSQEELGTGSGPIGMASSDAFGLVNPAVPLMPISHGSHGQLQRSVLLLLLWRHCRFWLRARGEGLLGCLGVEGGIRNGVILREEEDTQLLTQMRTNC